MKVTNTPPKAKKISDEILEAYENRDRRYDNDPDSRPLPPERMAFATRGAFYRPIKEQITVRIDKDVLDWLQSKGAGYQTRLNGILRQKFLEERDAQTRKDQDLDARQERIRSRKKRSLAS